MNTKNICIVLVAELQQTYFLLCEMTRSSLLTNFTVGMKYSGGLASSRAFPRVKNDEEEEKEDDLTNQRERKGTLEMPEVLLLIYVDIQDGK